MDLWAVVGRVLKNKACPSIMLSICWFRRFLGIGSYFFLNLGMVAQTDLYDFLHCEFFSRKWGKWAQNILIIIGHQFFLSLDYDENSYHLLYSCKYLVPVWIKLLLINQIAGFLNQLCLQNKIMILLDILYIIPNLRKLKVDWKLSVGVVKMSMATLVARLQDWLHIKGINGINWIFSCWYKFGGHGQQKWASQAMGL